MSSTTWPVNTPVWWELWLLVSLSFCFKCQWHLNCSPWRTRMHCSNLTVAGLVVGKIRDSFFYFKCSPQTWYTYTARSLKESYEPRCGAYVCWLPHSMPTAIICHSCDFVADIIQCEALPMAVRRNEIGHIWLTMKLWWHKLNLALQQWRSVCIQL